MYAPEFRKQGKQVALLAAELDRHLDAIRDPRGSFSRSTLTKSAESSPQGVQHGLAHREDETGRYSVPGEGTAL
jgi:hypothetical protein